MRRFAVRLDRSQYARPKDKYVEFVTLIVDDNAVYRDLLTNLLRADFPGMSVIEAGNCAETWQRLAECQPNLIFTDINLQEEDGLDLALHIRHEFPDVVVAIMTSYDGPEYRAAAYACGADCFVPKNSVSLSDIMRLVESIQSHRLPQWALGPEYLNPAPPAHPWN